MANRRKFIAGLGALATGSAAAVGTGAFTSVSADRTVDVNVSDDAAAFLRLEGTGGDNSEYVTQDGNGDQLAIDLTDSNDNFPGSTNPNGVNPDAVTQIDDLFKIQNQGTQEVDVGLTKTDDTGSNADLVTFYATNLDAGSSFDRYSSGGTGNTVDLGSSTDATLGTGDSVTVSVEIDTEGSSVSPGTQILDSVTINGDAT